MKKLLKITSVAILCCILVATFATSAFAVGTGSIMPRYSNVTNPSVTIDAANGQVTGVVTKNTGVTTVSGQLDLYVQTTSGWSLVNTWTGSTTRRTLSVTGSFTSVKGSTYKATFKITAVGSTTEVVTVEATQTY